MAQLKPSELKSLALEYLTGAETYLGNQPCGSYDPCRSLGKNYRDLSDAIDILREANEAVTAAPAPQLKQTPLEKSAVSIGRIYDLEDGSVTEVIAVDRERFEFEALKDAIKDEDVIDFLPFKTYIGGGKQHTHIVNDSAYTVETNSHFIARGETLCKRGAPTAGKYHYVAATCPGCVAKGKAIVVNHLLKQL
jgi:hypothetical protein